MTTEEDIKNLTRVSEEIPKKSRYKHIWTNKEGKQFFVVNMTNAHLYNSYMLTGNQALFQEMVLRMFEEMPSGEQY